MRRLGNVRGRPQQAGPARQLGSSSGRYNAPSAWSAEVVQPVPAISGGGKAAKKQANTNRLGRLEAVLMLADGPLPLRRLARAAGLAGAPEARELLRDLQKRLAARRSGLEVVEVAGGWRLLTRACLSPWLAKLGLEDPEQGPRLSAPAMETLAIVAYRQPVVRAEVEAIRGVGCGELLRQLLEADLLRIVGRSEELGKPLLYGVSDRFLELFGLRNLDDLPQPDEGAERTEPTKHNETQPDATHAA